MSEDRVPYVVNPAPAASTPLDLEAIEALINGDDHECSWIDGNNHNDILCVADELLTEVKRLRGELDKKTYLIGKIKEAVDKERADLPEEIKRLEMINRVFKEFEGLIYIKHPKLIKVFEPLFEQAWAKAKSTGI